MAATNCDVELPSALIEDFGAAPFSNTRQVQWMHARTPRFGHSRDVLALMQGTEDEQRDYIMGLISSSIAMFVFFLVWLLVLLALYSLGPAQAGWLAGKPRRITERPKDENAVGKWEKNYNGSVRRIKILRGLVMFAGFSIIISSILMNIQGVEALTRSVSDGREAIAIVKDLTQGGIDLIASVLEQNTKTGDAIEELLVDVNGICPALRDPICTDLADYSTCNLEGIFDGSDALEDMLQHFGDGDKNVYAQELKSAQDDLKDLLLVADDMDMKAKDFRWALWTAAAFSWIMTIICGCIMIGLAFRAGRCLNVVRHWILLPTFSIMVVLSFVFTVVFVMGSMALADMCVDTGESDIDGRIMVILNRFRDTLSPIGVEVASFYISQCPVTSIPAELSEQLEFVLISIGSMTNFADLVKSNLDAIQVLCETPNPAQIVSVAEETNQQLCQIAAVTKDIRLFFQCENWYPLYETAVHNAMCYNGTDGFSWIASTQFVIVFMATVLLTLRAAFYDVEVSTGRDGDDDGENDDETDNQESPQALRKDGRFAQVLPESSEAEGIEATAFPYCCS